ncbi:DUF4440 domain-containing protein [Salmonella enterica]
MLLEKLKTLECSLHGARRNDREWLEQILHQEFSEITRSGILIDRAKTIDSLIGEADIPIIFSNDFKLIRISDNFAILYYRTCNADGSRASLRSSCWECSADGQWKLVFHQGTPEAQSVASTR